MSEVDELKKKVDKALKTLQDCTKKPYLIPKKDLEEIITNSLGKTFHEDKKINLLIALLVLGVMGLILLGFIIWTLYFTVPIK